MFSNVSKNAISNLFVWENTVMKSKTHFCLPFEYLNDHSVQKTQGMNPVAEFGQSSEVKWQLSLWGLILVLRLEMESALAHWATGQH